MKYLIIALLLLIISCKDEGISRQSTNFQIRGAEMEIITIDSCEYIGYGVGQHIGLLTHKGNCKYCKQRK